MSIGILHPGAMGSSIGGALVGAGHEVLWASEGRGEATRTRAEGDGLTDVGPLAVIVERAETLISVCPPAEAVSVAEEVAGLGFDGLYLDANAIAPSTARTIASVIEHGGATYLDGGIIGPPARARGLTVLYLSGDRGRSDEVTALFDGGPLITHYLGDAPGAASAVKMAFAAWTKGTSALLLAIRALAEAEGVTDGLDHAWGVLTPELHDRLATTAAGVAPKAWRFAGEMQEIAHSFESVGLPGGFHAAAGAVYAALADLRDADDVDLAMVVERLTTPPDLTTDA